MEKKLKLLLNKHGFNFKKAYGQNFLTDESLLDKIVQKAEVDQNTTVIEIGCGAGALTKALCKKAKFVYGFEIDQNLKPVLNEVLDEFDNVELVFTDVMKEKMSEIERKIGVDYLLVANLPYYITTPLILNFLENSKRLKSMTVMVQKEVALRLCGSETSSDYGAISVAINLRGRAKIIADVNREMFTPVPNVDSAVVKIDIDRDKFSGVDFGKVRDLVRCAFISRRKMLINNLMNYYKLSREKCEEILGRAGLEMTIRGERLSAQNFVNLSEILYEYVK